MDTIDRIIELLNEYGYSQKDLTDYLGIKKSVFSAWKSKKSKSYNKYITQIAEFFNLNVEDIKIYELRESAIKRHGFFWEYKEREEKKADARNAIAIGNLDKEQVIENAIIIFKALFSRSLEASKFSPKHVCFEVYVSMLLNQESWKRICDEYGTNIYETLVGMYGKRKGIERDTYYNCEKQTLVLELPTMGKIFDLRNDIEKEISSKIYMLNPEGQQKVLDYINDLVGLEKYTISEKKKSLEISGDFQNGTDFK